MKVAMAYATVSVSDMNEALPYFRDLIGMEVKSDGIVGGESIDRLYGLQGVRARRVVMRLDAGSDLHLEEHLAHKGRPVASTLHQYDIGIIHLDVASKGIDQIYEDFQKKGVKCHCPVLSRDARKFRQFSFDGPEVLRLETHDWWVKHSEHDGHGTWLPDPVISKGFYALAHVALSVGELSKTLHLYKDILGMKITGESFLIGEEFDQMDSLDNGRADNVLVRSEEGSEIQFIHHLAHKGRGKQIASTLQQCDIGIVNIGLKTDDIEGLYQRLRDEGVPINCEIQVNPDRSKSFSFRDPDGNLLVAQQ